MFNLSIHSDFDFRSPEFADLFSRSDATVFQHPIWLHNLYTRVVSRLDAAPKIITLRTQADGKLVLLLPLVLRRYHRLKVIEFADFQMSDYIAPVCDRHVMPTITSDARINEQILAALKPYDLIWIRKLRDDAALIAGALIPGQRIRMDTSSHATKLFAPFEAWRVTTLEPEFQRHLDRKRKRLRKKGKLSFGLAEDAKSIEQALFTMRELRSARFRSKGRSDILHKPECYDFYLGVAIAGAQSGLSRTYILRLDDRPIGIMFGVAHQGSFLFLLMGFDFENLRNCSVGLLMLEHAAADCIARGDALFDLTIGEEQYKGKFGTKPSALWAVWNGGTMVGRLAGSLHANHSWVRRRGNESRILGGWWNWLSQRTAE
jgi:CelD/BcsL family acetyltransferase involved in cellulose biosynthesis